MSIFTEKLVRALLIFYSFQLLIMELTRDQIGFELIVGPFGVIFGIRLRLKAVLRWRQKTRKIFIFYVPLNSDFRFDLFFWSFLAFWSPDGPFLRLW